MTRNTTRCTYLTLRDSQALTDRMTRGVLALELLLSPEVNDTEKAGKFIDEITHGTQGC